jgi:hypothetical protein
MDGGLNWQLRCMAVDSSNQRILVGGRFRYAGMDSMLAKGLVAWEHDHWSMTGLADGSGDTLAPDYATGKLLLDMAMYHDTLFGFVSSDEWHYDPSLTDIIYLANDEWHPCATTRNDPFKLLVCNGHLFGGGPADTVNGQFMSGVKEWYGGSWHLAPNSPFLQPLSSDVRCVDHWHGRYYFGGLFDASGAIRVVSWDGANDWAPVGDGLGSNWVNKIVGYGDTLYAGGFLTETADQPSRHMRLWNGAAWRPFFPEVEFQGQVWDMQVYANALYILGVHHHVGSGTIFGVLRYDGHQLCSLGGPTGGESQGMAFYNDTLYYGISGQYPGLEQQWVGRLPLNGLVPDQCVTVSTGVDELPSAGVLRVLPNPVCDRLAVLLPTGMQAQEVVVYDALGTLVFQQLVHSIGTSSFNVGGLAPGAYAVTVRGAGQRLCARFVKE